MTNILHKPENTPLDCRIVDGVLRIVIGIDVLADAVQRSEPFNVYDENKRDRRDAWVITDKLEFAKDVARQLNCEFEDGSTILSYLRDKAAADALDDGSLGVEEGEPAWPRRPTR